MKKAYERADPEHPRWRDNPWFNVILERTYFARAFCPYGRVLDAPCGVGWTSAKLAERANYVLGVDYSQEAIELAKKRYVAENLEFKVMNCLNLTSLEKASFDVVCSIEALEHFEYSNGKRYIDQLKRVLRPGGILIGTTPSAFTWREAEKRLTEEEDQYHIFIWTGKELKHMLKKKFADVWVCPMPDGYFIFWAQKALGFKRSTITFFFKRLWRILHYVR